MIRYSLACDAGHRFDSWFRNSEDFDQLAGRCLVGCPACGSTTVAKAVMAPAVVAKRSFSPKQAAVPGPEATEAGSPPSPGVPAVEGDGVEGHRELRARLKHLREKVLAATQDVGSRFPDQARRMHEGEIPHRDIRGEATVDEARALLDDGIMILPVPFAPEDFN